MIFTDTHTHLYSEEFKGDINVVLQHSIEKGVSRFFLPNIDSSSIESMIGLCDLYPNNCYPMMGLHPCSVNENFENELSIVEAWLDKRKFYGVGEIGIDLYWDKTYEEQQKIAFKAQINWAKKRNLPVVIHTRNAFDETFEIVSKHNDASLRGIFHCFSGSLLEANKVVELGGFKLGIGGVVTYKNSGLDEVVRNIDLEHIVLETDSPYLAPVPYRGKRNQSAYIFEIATKISELHKVSIQELANITTQNSKIIFDI